MIELLRKILSVVLTSGIILSSVGFTILNHFCKLEQTNFVSVEEFYKTKCNHSESHSSCCENLHDTCCSTPGTFENEPGFKSFDDCCTDKKFFSKIEVATSEKSLKKFSDSFIISLKIDYIKKLLKDSFNQKYEQLKINIINPIKKIIKLIQIISNHTHLEKSEALL